MVKPKVDLKHPESEAKQSKALVDNIKGFISEIDDSLNAIILKRSVWEDRQVRWYKERYGIRGKKNFPFPGCSNMHIPIIDMQIKKLLPAYVNLLWGSTSVAEFRVLPNCQNHEDLRKQAEYNSHILNHLIKDRMDKSFEKTVMWTDRMLMSGFCIIKVTYDYKSEHKSYSFSLENDLTQQEKDLVNLVLSDKALNAKGSIADILRKVFAKKGAHIDEHDTAHRQALQKCLNDILQGKKKTSLKVEEVIDHFPKWTVVKPQDFIIDGEYNDIQESPLVCHRMYYSAQALRKMAQDGMFGKNGLRIAEEIIKRSVSGSKENSSYNQANKKLTGIENTVGNGLIEIREVHCFAKTDDTDIMRRTTLYYSPNYLEEPLKFVLLPYEDNKVPFVKVALEIKDDGFYSSRGIPAMLDYLATMINVRHNQRVDNLTIANSPMIKYIPGQVTMSNIRYIPGQGIPVKDMNALQPVVLNPGNTAAFLEEERVLKNYVENYIASPDFTLGDTSQPRKATEVLQIASQRKDVFSVDSKIYLSAVKELLEMTWSRWLQYGSEEYEIKVKGQKNPIHWERKNGEPLKIYPKGTLQDINPLIRAQKARQWLAVLSDPFVGKYYNAEEIAEYIASSIDSEKSGRFLLSGEEISKRDFLSRKQFMEKELIKAEKEAKEKNETQRVKMEEIKLKEFLKQKSELEKIKAKADVEENMVVTEIREKTKAEILKEMAKDNA